MEKVKKLELENRKMKEKIETLNKGKPALSPSAKVFTPTYMAPVCKFNSSTFIPPDYSAVCDFGIIS